MTGPGAHAQLKHRAITRLYRALPALKYWGVRRGYLTRVGWVASNRQGAPVDADGRPLPWLTYPAIHFLLGRLRSTMTVFEYGSGQSTRWWAEHVARVHSVEDDPDWYRRVKASVPANVDLRHADSSTSAYARSIAERDTAFDVVVIDGSNRDECARECLAYLRPDGVVVFDNSEDGAFPLGMAHLHEHGFRRIDFYGMTALNMDPHETAVLYRPGANNLGI